MIIDVRAATEQIDESVGKAVEREHRDSNVNDPFLPSLNDDPEIEESKREFEENEGEDVEHGE